LRCVDFVQENVPRHTDEVFSGVIKSNPRANARSLTTGGEAGVFLHPWLRLFRHLNAYSVGPREIPKRYLTSL